MTAETIGFVAVLTAVFAMLWRLHMDIEALRQDMHRGIGGLRQDVRDICCQMSRVERMLAGASLTKNTD